MEFQQVLENLDLGRKPVLLAEALSPKELEAMRKIVATPDVRPCDFDLSIDGWIARLELWGKVRITHTDPEFGTKNKVLTLNQFLDKVSATNINKIAGKFDIDRKDVNRVEMFREYVGANDKKYRESFMVTVELKPELKKALK